ncbi:MAG: hypothetical protein P8Z34_17175 [Anaerolineales bacterium]
MLTFNDGDLYFEGQSLPELIRDCASPFFLFSEPLLRANFRALQRGLTTGPNPARIRYCAKTNNEPAVLEVLQRLGSDVMVSHLAEAELALSCGFEPEQIAFQRPVLSADEIRSAIAVGVRFFHAFHMDDISLLGLNWQWRRGCNCGFPCGCVTDLASAVSHRSHFYPAAWVLTPLKS